MGNVITREAYLQSISTAELLKELDIRREKELSESLTTIRSEIKKLRALGFNVIDTYDSCGFVDVKQEDNNVLFEFDR